MRKYIKSSVDNSNTISIDGEWIDQLHCDESFSFLIIDDIWFEEDAECVEVESVDSDTVQSYLDFGMKIENGDLYIPRGLSFNVRLGKYSTYILDNNGTSVDWSYFETYPVGIKFTPLGYKCYWASESLNKSFDEVVKDILSYQEYFDIK